MQNEKPIPLELVDLVDRELAPGERVAWMEQPVPRHFPPKIKPLFIFGLF